MTRQTPTIELETATLLRALLKAIKSGEIEANTPQALWLIDQIEGAINAQLGRPGLIPEASIERTWNSAETGSRTGRSGCSP